MRQYRMIKTPLRDNEGNVTGLVGIREDITDRITLENALRDAQKMEAVGQLAGGVAHDFNNMMQIIINYAHFAVEEVEDSSKVRGFLDQILRAGKRATNLTRQLLAYSRKSIIRPKTLDLNQLAANLIGMLDVVIGENIALQLNSAAGLHPVRADPGMLEQVIINLCVNARDAMPDGGSLVIETQDFHADREFCDAHGWDNPGDYVMLAVRDNGVGMTPELQERIFEPFFTSKEVGQGTGLGLAMAYGIIRQHNGRIEVTSEPGAGSTFRIYLPREKKAAGDKARQADAVDSGGSGVTLGGRV
jgi:signal transduction histidine kinase